MGCGTTTVKIASIFFNIIFALFAIGAIIWIALNPDQLPNHYSYIVYVVCGIIVFFTILGCYAAIKETVPLLILCSIFLLLLAITQIVLTCLNVSDRGMRNGLEVVNLAWDNNEMDKLQHDHQCCGKDSAQDYILFNKQIPLSCYRDNGASTDNNLFLIGCSTKLRDYHEAETKYFTIVSWILIVFELLGFLLALCLVINFRNKQRRMQF